MKAKVTSVEELAAVAERLRGEGKKVVLTNGCFDLLHVGHVRYLEAAHALGDVLAVGLNGDESVRALKGDNRPLNRETDRAELLAALCAVDYVVIFAEKRATRLIEAVRPAVYVKGGDYTPETLDTEERAALTKVGADIRIIPFEHGYSTTRLLEQMQGP